MRTRMLIGAGVAALLGLSALGLAASVRASEDECRVPMGEWRPREELQSRLQAQGWQRIDQIKVDDGCYEAKGFDAEGWRVEAKYDPKTFELVKLERKRDRLRERERDPAAGSGAAGSGPAGAPAGGAGGGGN